MGERLGGECFHAALRDAPRLAQSIGQQIQFPCRAEAVGQAFLAVHHMLRSGVALLGHKRGQHAALRRHGIDGVLHHGQLAGGDRAQRGMTAGRNANGVLNLLPSEMQDAARDDGRDERRQRGVMPAAFANARESRLAEAHLEFMSQDEPDDQLLAIAFRALAAGQRRRKNVRRMRRVLLPVNVVVVHAADHQSIGQRSRDRVDAFAGTDHGRRTVSGDFVEHLERDLHVVLLISAQRTAHGIQQKAFGLVHRFLRELRIGQAGSPARHSGGNRFFGGSWFRSQREVSYFSLMFFGFLKGRNAMKSA